MEISPRSDITKVYWTSECTVVVLMYRTRDEQLTVHINWHYLYLLPADLHGKAVRVFIVFYVCKSMCDIV